MIDFLRKELIGGTTLFNTPFGKRLITYADYTASGKTLRFIEKYLIKIQEVYANTHTIDSFTGHTMTSIVKKAEKTIKQLVGANENNYIIPVGTGTTSAIAKLSEILGLYLTPGLKMNIDILLKEYKKDNRYNQEIIKDIFKLMSENKPVIFISPYEHHSNYLIWKESFADVVEICLSESGEFDYEDLENKLKFYHDRVKIGSFSAASNITGIKTDVYRVAKLMHQHKGLVFFDFACSAPYVEINMNKDEESYFDALFFSPHKFVGGPGSSGILIINKNIYNNLYPPTIAGGGTVQFVSPYCYSFVSDVEVRENAGTPGILQIIKASLALEVKHLVGVKKIITIEEKMIDKAITTLSKESNFIIYGPKDPKKRISILSFNIKHGSFLLHHRFVSKLLNDLFGIQSRAGCACAGPYAHRLLRIDREKSQALEEALKEYEVLRPGFVRINFHYLMSEEEVDYIIEALKFVSQFGHLFLSQYYVNLKKGFWKHNYLPEYNPIIDTFGIKECLENTVQLNHLSIPKKKVFKEYLDEAHRLANHLMINNKPNYLQFNEPKYEQLRWFNYQYYKEE